MATYVVPESIKAFAWDLDGTLIDSFGIYSEIVTKLAPHFGLPKPSTANLLANFHGTLSESLRGALGEMSDFIIDEFEKAFLSEQGRYYVHIDDHILADAKALTEKASVRGLKQVIVTNRDHADRGAASPRHIVEHSGLKDHIHQVICGDDAHGYRKPDAHVLDGVLADWGVEPQDLLIIGDQYVDALLALNAGARAIIVNRGAEPVAHLDRLPAGWQKHITLVDSLHDVGFPHDHS